MQRTPQLPHHSLQPQHCSPQLPYHAQPLPLHGTPLPSPQLVPRSQQLAQRVQPQVMQRSPLVTQRLFSQAKQYRYFKLGCAACRPPRTRPPRAIVRCGRGGYDCMYDA